MYLTYADILAKHFSQAEYINLARPSSGNLLLMSRLTQAHRYFKFNKDDLIVVMYPSFTREDRYLNTAWQGWGNIFTSSDFDYNFLRKYGDLIHYILRDLATIDLVRNFLKTIDSDKLELMSVSHLGIESESLELDKDQAITHGILYERYGDLFQDFPLDYLSWLTSNQTSLNSFGAKYDNIIDGHPRPIIGLDYLKFLGFEPNNEATDFAIHHEELLSKCSTRKEIIAIADERHTFDDRYYIAGKII
jgi:hypothetical protein